VLARQIAWFDKHAIAETKRLANTASLPSDSEIAPEWDAFMTALARPSTQARIKTLVERGFHKPAMSRPASATMLASWAADTAVRVPTKV
jgi:hypothetical protein